MKISKRIVKIEKTGFVVIPVDRRTFPADDIWKIEPETTVIGGGSRLHQAFASDIEITSLPEIANGDIILSVSGNPLNSHKYPLFLKP